MLIYFLHSEVTKNTLQARNIVYESGNGARLYLKIFKLTNKKGGGYATSPNPDNLNPGEGEGARHKFIFNFTAYFFIFNSDFEHALIKVIDEEPTPCLIIF